MRKVLSSTAGATFHEETPTFTINVKKEMIELIYKLAPSWYVRALIENLTHEVINAGLKLANKNLQVYRELFQNPPFPAWKEGLNEVWN